MSSPAAEESEETEMNPYVTGTVIRALREQNHMTQAQLAEQLCVSDKAISKWETGKGYPDITLLKPIADAFHISLAELISGELVHNQNVSGNLLRAKFYVCPVCGNIFHSMGEAVIHCHGIQLLPCIPEMSDEAHKIFIERAEDEYYVRIDHPMTKQHFISMIAAVSPDRLQLVKRYPEGNSEARFRMDGVKKIVFLCNRDGLFYTDVIRGIDDKQSGYDDTEERRELEKAAASLFGSR